MSSYYKDLENLESFLSCVVTEVKDVSASLAQGSLAVMVEDCFRVNGKLTRPKAVFAIAKAFGADLQFCSHWAACCEILHGASLVHDDLQDGDVMRRGRPTMWARYGSNMAINLGDYLLQVAPMAIVMSGMPQDLKLELHKEFMELSSKMVAGQCDELLLNRLKSNQDLYERYLHCIGGKTAIFFAKLARGVGVLANLGEYSLSQLEKLYFDLGLLFQMQDDILDLFGDKMRMQVGCDLREGKVSFLIVHHLNLYPQNFSKTKAFLNRSRHEVKDVEVLRLRGQFRNDGTLEKSIEDLLQRAKRIQNHTMLSNHVALKRVTLDVLENVLLPIEHLIEFERVGNCQVEEVYSTQ